MSSHPPLRADPLPGVPPPDREWGWCRRVTPALENLLKRKQLWHEGCDHVVVLRYDAKNVILCFWRGERALSYVMTVASVGRDVARLGAPESV